MLTNCLAGCAHLTITVSEIERDICEKIVILSYPLHSTPPLRGGSRRNIAIPFGMEKLEWWGPGYPTVNKNFKNMCNRLGTIPACDRQIDGETDRQTSCHGIVRAMHTRCAVKTAPFLFVLQ